jgi:hypothetical protein
MFVDGIVRVKAGWEATVYLVAGAVAKRRGADTVITPRDTIVVVRL